MSGAADAPLKKTEHRGMELCLVLFLALFGTARVAVNALSFPFFGHIDEVQHIDTLLKYAALRPPSVRDDAYLPETTRLKVYFASPEYLPAGALPIPPVLWPDEVRRTHFAAYLKSRQVPAHQDHNYEAMQPPTYYLLAGAWLRFGRWLGMHDIDALYFARLFGALCLGATVLLAWLVPRCFAPEHRFVRLAAPTLLAVLPQDCFYFITNDPAGAPLGGLSLLLLLWLRRRGSFSLGLAAGISVGATALVKVNNLLVFFAAGAIAAAHTAAQLRADRPALDRRVAGFALGAGTLFFGWIAWAFHASGEFYGTRHKTTILGYQAQTWDGLRNHPMWSLDGLWTFVSHTCGNFWRGEVYWHGVPMRFAWFDTALLVLTAICLGASLGAVLLRRPTRLPWPLALPSYTLLVGGLLMLFGLSLYWDFARAYYPSTQFPFAVSGRLLTLALVPFAVCFCDGLSRIASRGRTALLVLLALVLLGTELLWMFPVIESDYNFWHLPRQAVPW